jgi:hypothetical protein
MKVDEVLEKRFTELRGLPNVLNVAVGTKIVDGKDTGKPCIVLYVSRKVEVRMLNLSEMAPLTVEGVPTDVVELKADYTLGDTEVSRKPPEVQRRVAGGVKR